MKSLTLLAATAASLALIVAGGCSTGADDTEGGGSALSGPEADACKIFVVKDQAFVDLDTFANDPKHPERKNDPVLQKLLAPVLQGKSCPKNFAEMQQLDTIKSCSAQTRIVSERSALLGTPDVGRALASRTCGGSDPTLFFLLDPVNTNPDLAKPFLSNETALAACKGKAANTACTFKDQPTDEDPIVGTCTVAGATTPGGDAGAAAGGTMVCLPPTVPTDVEVLGNDSTDGIFSYYAREPQAGPGEVGTAIWKFYGTSTDFVSNGYDCDVKKFHGACQSKFAQDNGVPGNKSGARCASCHPGGGMVQKELNSPWSNWMIEPGQYVQKHSALLGNFQNGDSFEPTTTKMNTSWAKKRAEILSKLSVKEMLRPVFCTMDTNLQSGGNPSFGMSARNDLMIDLLFASPQQFFSGADAFGGIGSGTVAPIDPASYTAAITAVKQTIPADFPNNKTFSDTADPFIYPERSNLDHQYVAALKAQNLVTEDLLRDILFVDFTRPIFSSERCSLVDDADGITAGPTMKDQFIKKLQGKTSPTQAEKDFLAALTNADPAPRHQTPVTTYLNACKARAGSDKAGFANDVVAYVSQLRRQLKLMRVAIKVEKESLGILDFDETVPRDSTWGSGDDAGDAPITERAFDPSTCVLSQ